MDEPIKHFYKLKGFRRSDIKDWVIGDKYVALMNKKGNIGVCATLGTSMNDRLLKDGKPQLNDPVDRIILNAYFNAHCNYERSYDDIKDIFDSIDFSKHRKIIMIGYFESLYQKFSNEGIPLEVFDLHKESHILSDICNFRERVQEAETIILTGTSIFNNTFNDIMGLIPEGCKVFLLGPSNILSEEMFRYRGIRVVFGSVFENSDHRILEMIKAGSGTRGFLPYLRKVYIVREDYKNEIQ